MLLRPLLLAFFLDLCERWGLRLNLIKLYTISFLLNARVEGCEVGDSLVYKPLSELLSELDIEAQGRCFPLCFERALGIAL